jgi:diguanylate cyclase (GGDEF)-like protein
MLPPPPQTLLLATAALLLVSALFTANGLRQRRYQGFGLWRAALWLAACGALGGAVLPAPAGPALAAPLLMQWPVLALVGLRRFNPRQALPGSERLDWALLAVAGMLASAAAAADAIHLGWGLAWLATACGVLLHLYAAALLFTTPGGREATPIHALGVAVALVALVPSLLAWPSAEMLSPLWARAATAALGALVLAFMGVTLVSERTERQLRDSRRRLRTLANLDALTQVPNRRHFQELATMALRDDIPGSAVLVLFDVDHFKLINDELGHAAGDRALCLVCNSVLEHLRAQDVPGRHGGDEFVLLLRQTTTRQAMGVAARIVTEVQKRAPRHDLPALSAELRPGADRPGRRHQCRPAPCRPGLVRGQAPGPQRAVAALGNEHQPVFSESQRLGLTPA